jgi:Mg2+/Co2+ transporter CorB
VADSSVLWLSGSIVALLFGSAFFSMSETALMAANRNKLRQLADEQADKRAKRALRLLEKPEQLIATILVGNNIMNVAASALATALAIELFGDIGIGLATGAMTLIVLVWGEVTPKSFAAQKAEWVSMRISAPIAFFEVLFKPVSRALTGFANTLIQGMGGRRLMQTPFLAEDEIKVLLDVGQEEGSIEEHEADFIEGIFEFTDKELREVCRPFKEVVWLRPEDPLTVAVDKANASGHSRLPVVRQDSLEVLGMVYVKDLLFISDSELGGMTANQIIRPIGRFSPKDKLAKSFQAMQKGGFHLAMVLEPDGHPLGLVSMEDLLEEIVGDIIDEYEMGRRRVVRARKAMKEEVTEKASTPAVAPASKADGKEHGASAGIEGRRSSARTE